MAWLQSLVSSFYLSSDSHTRHPELRPNDHSVPPCMGPCGGGRGLKAGGQSTIRPRGAHHAPVEHEQASNAILYPTHRFLFRTPDHLERLHRSASPSILEEFTSLIPVSICACRQVCFEDLPVRYSRPFLPTPASSLLISASVNRNALSFVPLSRNSGEFRYVQLQVAEVARLPMVFQQAARASAARC